MRDGEWTGTLIVSKSLFIKSFGCQMNVYDSGRITDVLAPLGYDPVADATKADVVILNTCHIREKAAEKVYSDLGRLRLVKDRRHGVHKVDRVRERGNRGNVNSRHQVLRQV